jgi:regulatory protein
LKGVQREIVDELVDEEQDEERALRAGRKKALLLVRQSDIDYVTFQRRLGPFLQRRGFGYEATAHAVKKLWQELKGEREPMD